MNDAAPAEMQYGAARSFEISVGEFVSIFRDKWKWIAAAWFTAALVSFVYAYTSTPVFRTNALIQVEEKNSGLTGLGDLTTLLTGSTPTEAEIEIVRSRSVLGAAIAQKSLDIEVKPVFFPLLGSALARRHDSTKGLADAPFGLDRFAWGGERIGLDRLEVPRALQGTDLTLIAGDGGTYSVYFDDELLLQGKVGSAAEGRGVSMFVSRLTARPATPFHLVRNNWLRSLDELKSRLSVAERGRQTGIMQLTLDGESPQLIADTLNSIAAIYLRQNVERTSEDAAKTLEFLDGQLPDLKDQLDTAEAELNQYRVRQGTIDLSLETQGLLQQVAEVERQISELELREAELGQRFTSEHPVMAALGQQRAELAATRENVQAQIRSLPANEQVSLRLMRDVQVANELYMLLLNRAQELKVVRAGTVGNVRIIDQAFVPLEPFKPRKALLLLIGSALGLLAGALAVYLREALNPAIRDPEELEKLGSLPVYAIVPHSDQEERLNASVGQKASTGQLLLSVKSDDVAIESLRSLRTSMEFLLLDVSPKIVTIGGPAPGAGKSFITANLAALFVQTGKKVLLIDTDLRKGHLHRLFSLRRGPGLTELIAATTTIDDVAHRVIDEGLDLITTGVLPPNPAELITSTQFERILSELGRRYDIVLMDAPPVLGAAEAVNLARLSTINLLVIRSEKQTPREVDLALNKLAQVGASPKGFVLNDLQMGSRRHSYAGYHYYRYNKS